MTHLPLSLYHWVLSLCSLERAIPRASNDNEPHWVWLPKSKTFFQLPLAEDSHLADYFF